MQTVTARNQQELDEAVKDIAVTRLFIDSDPDEKLSASGLLGRTKIIGQSNVRIGKSNIVEVYDEAKVTAWRTEIHTYNESEATLLYACDAWARNESKVTAYNNCWVSLRDSAQGVAYENSQLVAYNNSRSMALHRAEVYAYENSFVQLHGEARVYAHDLARIEASGFSTVNVFDSTVEVETSGNAFVRKCTGQIPPEKWIEQFGIKTVDGKTLLYKAVDDNFYSPHGFAYLPGTEVIALDWIANEECGSGLHFSPSPVEAKAYFNKATKFVACLVDEMVVINSAEEWMTRPKCKAPRATVLYEVDIFGERL